MKWSPMRHLQSIFLLPCVLLLLGNVHEMDPTFFNDKEKVEKIINLYEEKSVLWDLNIADYHDRNKIMAAKTEIMNALNLTSVEDVTKKLKAIRDARRRYLMKIKSTPSGSGTADVHKSKIWWINNVAFLDATFAHRPTKDNTNDDSGNRESIDNSNDPDTLDTNVDIESIADENTASNEIPNDQQNAREVMDVKKKRMTEKKKSMNKISVQQSKLLDTADRCFAELSKLSDGPNGCSENDDDASVFGKYIAAELRKIPNQTTLAVAKYEIQNIITKANLNLLRTPQSLQTSHETRFVRSVFNSEQDFCPQTQYCSTPNVHRFPMTSNPYLPSPYQYQYNFEKDTLSVDTDTNVHVQDTTPECRTVTEISISGGTRNVQFTDI